MRREDAPPSNSTIADTLMLFFSRSQAAGMSHRMLEFAVCKRPSSLFCMKNTQATFRQKSSIIQAPVPQPEVSGRVKIRGALEGRL